MSAAITFVSSGVVQVGPLFNPLRKRCSRYHATPMALPSKVQRSITAVVSEQSSEKYIDTSTPCLISRRHFLSVTSSAALAALLPTLETPFKLSRVALAAEETPSSNEKTPLFALPPLPYAYDALQPYISEQIMHAHHDVHFAGYVEKLNTALEKLPDPPPSSDAELIKMLSNLDKAISDKVLLTTVRNNGGGYLNHKLFFSQMSGNARPLPSDSQLSQALIRKFSSFEAFQTQFLSKSAALFGSGFTWLVRSGRNDIDIIQTPNQDNPVMSGMTPILACDCWEHAWYYQYGPMKKQYLVAWWNVIDWPTVNDIFTSTA